MFIHDSGLAQNTLIHFVIASHSYDEAIFIIKIASSPDVTSGSSR